MAGDGGGFVLLWRQIFEHPYWTERRVFSRAEAWIDCWGNMAAYENHQRIVSGNPIALRRGEFIASERFLERRWSWSRGKVRRYIQAAIDAGELRREREVNGGCSEIGTSGGTIYAVVKYDDYQPRGTSNSTSDGPLTVPVTDQRETSKASKATPLTTTQADSKNVENVVDAVMIAGNNAMHENPLTPNAEPILLSHASRQSVFDWLHAGVPAELISSTVADRARTYKPTGRRRQITSMRYFDEAVLTAFERKDTQDKMAAQIPADSEAGRIKAAGKAAESPKSPAPRAGGVRQVGTNEDVMTRERDEHARVAAWKAANPKDAERIWNEIRDELYAKGADALGQRHFANAVEAHFRQRIIAEHLTPKLAAS